MIMLPGMLSSAVGADLLPKENLAEKWDLARRHMDANAAVILIVILISGLLIYRAMAWLWQKPALQKVLQKKAGYPLKVIKASGLWLYLLAACTLLLNTRIYSVFPDFLLFLQTFITVSLCTKIAGHILRLMGQENTSAERTFFERWTNTAVWAIRFYALVYLAIYRFVSPEHFLLTPIRILSEIVLTAGIFFFWYRFKKIRAGSQGIKFKLANGGSKLVALTGLLADLAGYNDFASRWLVSWGGTIVAACVGALLVYSLIDLNLGVKGKLDPVSRTYKGVPYPLYWFFYNGLYLFIMAVAIAGIALSWGAGNDFFSQTWQVLNKKFMMGKLELSFSGFFNSVLILLLTYLFTQVWQKIMAGRVLDKSGLSLGARDSVITILNYLIWSVGILISLSVFGLNTTGLTVALGALGIGLGFGLQNIFNNFISGLILLFERPIQVGDVVEIGGAWGEVKKINVRATLVQTYDNSSLILPNSEFISAKVTNWSHKDPFIRRDVNIGVAYGSDTAQVKELLLQAADNVKEVYRHPVAPAVHFIDFGDSSLDFRVRFWTTINDFILAESNLRFEIDNIFKANGIVIPFPQRDLHIKQPGEPKTL